KLCKLLEKSKCLRNMNLGFGLMCFEDKKLVLTAGGDISYNTLTNEGNLCGLRFWTPNQRATIGSVITINSLPFLLTVAHVFYPDECRNEGDEGDSTSSNMSTESFNVTNNPQSIEASNITPQCPDHILDYLGRRTCTYIEDLKMQCIAIYLGYKI
ncbi:MAG: hypothetical protein Q9164_007893, partial [Protoblastenia rupestris]